MENPINMDDLRGKKNLFSETPMYNLHIHRLVVDEGDYVAKNPQQQVTSFALQKKLKLHKICQENTPASCSSGAVSTLRDGVFRHPKHHPFSTQTGRSRQRSVWKSLMTRIFHGNLWMHGKDFELHLEVSPRPNPHEHIHTQGFKKGHNHPLHFEKILNKCMCIYLYMVYIYIYIYVSDIV